MPKTTTTNRKRVGRGQGSNRGKNSGKGNKGQVKRAGKMPVGFEGGNNSLMKRIPKSKGFKVRDNNKQAISLTLGRINTAFESKEIVSLDTLKVKGIIDSKTKKVRIVKTGEYTKQLTFEESEFLYLTKGVRDVIS